MRPPLTEELPDWDRADVNRESPFPEFHCSMPGIITHLESLFGASQDVPGSDKRVLDEWAKYVFVSSPVRDLIAILSCQGGPRGSCFHFSYLSVKVSIV